MQLRHNTALTARVNEMTERTEKRLDEFRLAIGEDARKARQEGAEQQRLFAESLGQKLTELTTRNEQRMGELRATLDTPHGLVEL